MSDSSTLALAFLLLLSLAPAVLGALYNLWLGRNAVRWLEKGLPLAGDTATFSRQGVSTVRLKLLHGKDPFRSAEIHIVLEPRELWPLWLWSRLRGRRDLVVFRAQLKNAPHFDVEARTLKLWPGPGTPASRPARWSAVQGGVANNMAADYRGAISPFSINRLIVVASGGQTLTRLAVHGPVPNLEVHFVLPRFDRATSRELVKGLRDLAELILQMSR